MKVQSILLSLFLCLVVFLPYVQGQEIASSDKRWPFIVSLIDSYSQAREQKDTVLLKSILLPDVDQLVSSGVWRRGIGEAIKGMMQSSTRNPGTRTLTVERIRLLKKKSAIVDARYEIRNSDGSTRKMWSTFIVVNDKGRWKISAIRNMLPAR